MEPWLAALTAFALVFLAELGDRTQFVLFALATRHPRGPLFFGAVCAFAVQTGVAVVLGDRLHAWLPTGLVLWLGGAVFLVLGGFALVSAWRSRAATDAPETPPPRYGAFVTALLFVLIAEAGDKTQIAAASLAAATGAPVATFVGAFFALAASAGLALVVGVFVARRFSAGAVRWVAAGAFILAGSLMIGAAVF